MDLRQGMPDGHENALVVRADDNVVANDGQCLTLRRSSLSDTVAQTPVDCHAALVTAAVCHIEPVQARMYKNCVSPRS